MDAFSATFMDGKSPETAFNLHFGSPGAQVDVEQDLAQKIILVLNDGQKTSFKIPTRKYPKFRMTAVPSEGTLSKGQTAIEVNLTLRIACTTTIDLHVPVIFWRGNMKDYDKAIESDGSNVFACYFCGKIQSRLSRRLDIEELLLYRPSIGSGAFGTVYRGTYRGQNIACKILKDQDDMTETMFNDFKTEVKMFDDFRHPCIVNFIGAVWFPGSLAMVTELCKYGSLPSAMKKYSKHWNAGLKLKAMYDCACAMDFLHQSSIIHRDLKPDNLLVTSLKYSEIVCKLSDFGTTKGVAGDLLGEMRQTKGVGTPLFMAPEVMRGSGNYTTKADVYSFGILMASVIDGEEPYKGDTRFKSAWEFTDFVVTKNMRPVVKNASSVPPEVIKLMELCWNSDPAIRPAFNVIMEQLQPLLPEDDEE